MPDQIIIPQVEKGLRVTSRTLLYLFLIVLSVICGVSLLYFDPIVIAGIVGVLLMTALLFYYPYLGVLVYLVFEYARIQSMFPSLIHLQIGKLIVLPTVAIWLIRSAVMRKKEFVSDKINWLMIFWLVLALFSSVFAGDSKLALSTTLELAKWVVIYFLLTNLVDTIPKWQWAMWFILLLNFKMSQFQIRGFFAGYGIVEDQDFFVAQGVGVGARAFFTNATDFGAAICVVAPFALYLIKAVKSKVLKTVGLFLFSCFAISILLSGSRGAALALFVMLLFFWFKSPQKLLIGILIAVFTISFLASATPAWKSRFYSALNYQQDQNASSRIKFWKAGAKMLVDHPLTGVGIDNFGLNYAGGYSAPGERAIPTAPHSIFVQAGAELGILGIVNLLIILYLIFKRNRETRALYLRHKLKNDWIPNFAHALDLSLIGFVIAGTFLTILYYPHLFIIMTLSVSLNQITKKLAG
jgi:putative inorganic carbon (HCO3(-)) transporter